MTAATLQLTWPQPDVAQLTFDAPNTGANVLSSAVLAELDEQLDGIEARRDVAGLIIASGKPGMFIAGADLREFVGMLGAPAEQTAALCRQGRQVFSRLSRCRFPTVAAIDGVCLGGGAEVAMWCDHRIMTRRPKARIGFPEVKLGLFPGWGATARLPRMVGLGNALQMITGGATLSAREASAMGLALDVEDEPHLLDAAVSLIRDEAGSDRYRADRRRWAAPVDMSPAELQFLATTASAMIRKETKGQYPAPLAAMELMLESSFLPLEQACDAEAAAFARLFGSEVNRALLNVFFLTDRNKKDQGVDTPGVASRPVQQVGVLGAGIMGAGIAAANIKRGVPVLMADASREALVGGARSVLAEAAYDQSVKGPTVEKSLQLAPLLNLGSERELASCDLVVEAITENEDVKRQTYARLEPLLSPDAVLGSNTSTIPITALARDLQRPDRFCGLHFFNPVRRMQLVEVVRGEATSDETIATVVAYAKRIGKMPIVVNDGPGFLVNRLLSPYMNESIQLLTEGAPIPDIERAAVQFGMPLGPLALYDMVGLDTSVLCGKVMWKAFPGRVAASPILPAMVKQGKLGQKSGSGFFSYNNKHRRAEPNPEFEAFLSQYIRQPGKSNKFDNQTLTARLFLPMLLEATRVLEEQLVRDVRDVDLGLIFALGFPAFSGGLLYWADQLGAKRLVEMLKPLAELGPRFQPTELLAEMAAHNRTFYR